MQHVLKGQKSLYFKIFAIFILVFSSLLPSTYHVAYAEDGYEENENEDGTGATKNVTKPIDYERAKLNKQVTRSNGNPGEYFIDLTIEGKAVPADKTTDIVLVYDNSNSMSNNNRVGVAREATINFVEDILSAENNANGNYQIALITFGTVVLDGRQNTVRGNGWTDDLSHKTLTTNPAEITSKIPSTIPTDRGKSDDGGTFTQQGIREAGQILANSTADNKVIITITDGVPTVSYTESGQIVGDGTSYTYSGGNHGDNTIREANQLKASYNLFSIGIEIAGGQGATEPQVRNVITQLASADQAYFATEVQEIEDHLHDITINLTEDAVIDGGIVTDPMGEMFKLKVDGEFNAASDEELSDGDYYLSASDASLLDGVTVNYDNNGLLNVHGLNLGEDDWVNLRYKIQLDTENEDFEANRFFDTNGPTTLQPRGDHPEEKYDFPIPKVSGTSTSLSGEKLWEDYGQIDLRPEQIEIELWKKGAEEDTYIQSQTVTPNEDGEWHYTFEDLIEYDSNGNYIEYFVKEAAIDGYEAEYVENSNNIRNVLVENPEISLVKEADRDGLVAGENITYTFTVENTGNVPLSGVVVTDELENISDVSYLTINGEAIEDESSITLAPGDVLVAEATYTVTQADVDRGQVVNDAMAIGVAPNDEEVTDTDRALVPQDPDASIELVKTSDEQEITEAGQEVTYTFEVTNTGNVTLTDIEVQDDMLGGAIELEKTTLAPGEKTTGSATYTVTQADLDNGSITNLATATGNPPNPDDPPVTDEDEDEKPIEQAPSISLDKEADKEELVVGEDITYTFTVTNTGNVTLYDVEVTDILEGISEVSYLTINGEAIEDEASITLAPGDVLVAEATYTVTQADVDRGQVVNHATATGTTQDDEEVTDTDRALVPQDPDASIELVKTSNEQVITEVGQTVTYTFEVTNTGNVTLTDIEVQDDMLGGAIELEKTTLAPGEKTTGSATYTVTQADLDNGSITNLATVTGNPPNPDDPPVTDEDEDEKPIEQAPSISLVKTSDEQEITEVGQEVTYTFEVTNTGNVTLSDIEVQDDMLGGAIELEKTTLAPGEKTTGSATYTVTQADLDNGSITNLATATGNPPNPDDPPVTDEDEDEKPVEQAPSISLDKAADRDNLVAGEDITYTFTVTNTGNVTLSDVVVTDILEGISEVSYLTINGEDIEDEEASIKLAPGDVLVAEATYTVTQADVDRGQIENEATATGTPPAGEEVTDEDDEIVTQAPDASLELVKTSDEQVITKVGQTVTYTFEVTNTGNVTLSDIEVQDDMLGGAIELEKTTLAPGEKTTGSATYTVTQADLDNGGITNLATATGNPPNPEDPPVTDDDEDEKPIEQAPSISLNKEADKEELVVGEDITYTFTVTNTGNVTLSDVEVTDILEGISEVSYLTINGEAIEDEASITLAPGDVLVAEATYTVTQADVDRGQVVNDAMAIGVAPNDEEVTDTDRALVPQDPDARLELVKTSDEQEITEAGQEVTYTFEVTNTGNVTLTGIEVQDPMLGGAIELEETSLAPGEKTTGSATYTVTQADIDNGGITNIATAVGTTSDGIPVTDEDSDWIPRGEIPAPKDGDKLPKTATNIGTIGLIGLLLVIAGASTMMIRRAKKQKEA